MKFKAEIDMSNAAFEDNPEELKRILGEIAQFTTIWQETRGLSGTIKDSNGNTIGLWTIK